MAHMSAVETKPWPSIASLSNPHLRLRDSAAVVWLLLVVLRLLPAVSVLNGMGIIDDRAAFVLLDSFKADSASSTGWDGEESLRRQDVFRALSTALAWLTLARSHCILLLLLYVCVCVCSLS